ncbi:sporulation inhibitor of replication protein SirA [Halalkalibacter krulwichiae]|uniref:Sporulation inhibitor of replication protein SirA n=1 Tax=Halalkalibacter krulwichiae TaxID=199441 RepID=A0A1X9MJW6_9BACI|nr:sporulation inhibitor of replication protein SirA [Halalkalibacter krulwichiae]ARK30902.1 Sporulation inhibitor of replication protein SirA [Halalkalibacter krulwichiae]
MRHYEIYIIEEDVARQYYGQESKLFYLFLEHEKAKGPQKQIIRKQIEYITKPIPTLLLQQKVKQDLTKNDGYRRKKNTHVIEIQERDSKAELVISSDALYVTAEGSFDVETIFFEILRKCEPSFFACSLEDHRFGWLKPLKQEDILKTNQV